MGDPWRMFEIPDRFQLNMNLSFSLINNTAISFIQTEPITELEETSILEFLSVNLNCASSSFRQSLFVSLKVFLARIRDSRQVQSFFHSVWLWMATLLWQITGKWELFDRKCSIESLLFIKATSNLILIQTFSFFEFIRQLKADFLID